MTAERRVWINCPLRVWAGSEFEAADWSRDGERTVGDSVSLSAVQGNYDELMIVDDRRYSGCTDQSCRPTRAPCHGKRQTSRRIIYILYCWQPETSITRAAVVQRGWRLVLSRPNERRCSEFVAAVDERPRCSSQTDRCSSQSVTCRRYCGECRGYEKIEIFDEYIALSQKLYKIGFHS